MMIVLGCGPSLEPQGGGAASTGNGDVTSTGRSGSSTGIDPSTSSGAADTTDDGDGFIIRGELTCASLPPGTLGHCSWCEPSVQDCPSDEKCTPFAADGDASVWSATRCSPIPKRPAQIGEPCVMEGAPTSGLDDCALGSMCWGVDPETLEGCVPFCSPPPIELPCDPGLACSVSSGGYIMLCLPPCDPLATDSCTTDEVCVPDGYEGFFCYPQPVEPLDDGMLCEVANQCGEGRACVAGGVSGCDEIRCCASMCDLSVAEPNPSCSDGTQCMPIDDRFENVGVCTLVR